MQWQRNKRLRYRCDEQTFSISLLPSVSRVLILLVLDTFILVAVIGSLGEPTHKTNDGPLAYSMFALFVLWPWFNDLVKWLPTTVYRDGRLHRPLRRASADPARMTVYYSCGGKFTSLGISYPNGNGGRRKFELKEADGGCGGMAEVGQKLATWLNVRYKAT
ncbi:hypothetical protein ACFDR9_003427 [Janthinobacterium sp. CG_23.3]|uniref:hypothetical protein n=1 Tax=Janthinobacterium sp. CG_23.3 TaxID=3349634 RepID=UPI0038D4A2A9